MKRENRCFRTVTLGAVCFSAGVLLSFFLPAIVLIMLEALLAVVVGILKLI